MKNFIYVIFVIFLSNAYLFSMEEEHKVVFETIRNVAKFYTTNNGSGNCEWNTILSLTGDALLENLNSNHYHAICNVFFKAIVEAFCIFCKNDPDQVEKNGQNRLKRRYCHIEDLDQVDKNGQETLKFLYCYINGSDRKIRNQNGEIIQLADKVSLLSQIQNTLCITNSRLRKRYEDLNKNYEDTKKEYELLVDRNNDLLHTNEQWRMGAGLFLFTTVGLILFIVLFKAEA
ncbi:MAG TPA: hypothetical protein VL201_01295 [Patescibacteria group bacterium]|nr:hypothetical protein [Patescibacteria group bacterium]